MRDKHETVSTEPFVSAEVAAKFLGINRRFLLTLARKGIGGSYSIGCGDFRKKWIFRLSELGVAIDHRHPRPFPDIRGLKSDQGSPR